MVLTEPTADEILELHFVRHMVIAGLASDRIFALQIARLAVLGVSGSSDQMELALGWNSFSLERLLSWKYNFILSRTEF